MAAQPETIIDRIRADHRKIIEKIAELERRVTGQHDDTQDRSLRH